MPTAPDVAGDRIRLLHVLPDKAVRFPLFAHLALGLDRDRYEQTVCCLKGDASVRHELEDHGIDVIGLGGDARTLRRFRPRLAGRIAAIVRERSIDLLHAQRHKPTVYAAVASWRSGRNAPVVTTVHGRERTRRAGRRLVNRLLRPRIARIIAVSDAVRRDVLESNPGLAPERVVTVFNGIDAERFEAAGVSRAEARRRVGLPDDGAFTFIAVGRLAPVKAPEVLLEAFAGVVGGEPAPRLALVGRGPLEDAVDRQAAALGVADRVVRLGQRADVEIALRAADAFVLASRSEGLPLSLLEAMASGLPVIATRVGGVPEVLTAEGPGAVVPSGDAAALAAAMSHVCTADEATRRAAGAALRARVHAAFTRERMVAGTDAAYMAALGRAAPVHA